MDQLPSERRARPGLMATLKPSSSPRLTAGSRGMNRATFGVAAVVALLGFGPAAVEAGPPTEALRRVFIDVNKLLTRPVSMEDLPARMVAVGELLDPVVEFRGAAERALGREWQARTVTEQGEFVDLFAGLLSRALVHRMAAVADARAGISVVYRAEVVDGGTTTVQTAVAARNGGTTLFDYEMVRHDERWKVRDVLIEGISVVANLRAQFQRVIQDSSYAGLVHRMRATVVKESRAPTVTAMDAATEVPMWTLPGENPHAGADAVRSIRGPGPAQSP
jgi:phospholipid transport system substrate-binding protein